MRRDMDLIRQLLFLIEDQGHDMNSWIEDVIVEGFSEEQVTHHTWLLMDGGFATGIDLSTSDGNSFKPRCLTWQGQEFLAAIRDKEIWDKTLDIAKQGGSGTISAIIDIAKSLAKKKLEKLLDVA